MGLRWINSVKFYWGEAGGAGPLSTEAWPVISCTQFFGNADWLQFSVSQNLDERVRKAKNQPQSLWCENAAGPNSLRLERVRVIPLTSFKKCQQTKAGASVPL
jgi:hypothetical protein